MIVDAVVIAAVVVAVVVVAAAVISEDAEGMTYLPWDCPTAH